MAGKVGSIKKGISRAGKLAGNAVGLFTKLRYHYGWHFKHSPVDERAILFESFHGKTMSDSPLHMLLEFARDPRSEGFRIYYGTSLENLAAHRTLACSLGLDVEFVAIESWKYVKVLATAKYLVNNSSFPAYFTRRPEQRYIQTWHGTPLKTLGKSMRLGIESMYNVQHNFLQADILTFPNEFTRDVMMRDYNLDDLYTGKVALLGYPRNTVFFDASKAAEIREYHGLVNKEAFAYMPTWRGANNYTVDVQNYRDEVMGYLHAIDDALRDDQVLYVNFHSMVASKLTLDSFEHVFPFPADEDSYEFLNAMDALITDYSSVFFDFSITRKPIVLFIYDKDAYLSERGMYLDIEALPFPKARTIEELVGMISGGSLRECAYQNSDYERDFLAYDSPGNARNALDLLFGDACDGVPVIDYSANAAREWTVVEPRLQKTVADIRTACEATDPERDVVRFAKSSFNEDKSRLLHDEYRDRFNFVFATKAYTCTALEEVLGKRTDKGRKLLAERERQRVFPNLGVSQKAVADVFVGTEGTSRVWDEAKLKPVVADVSSADGALAITIDVDADGVTAPVCISAIQDGIVIWHRLLSEEETRSGMITETFGSLRSSPRFPRGAEAVLYLGSARGAHGLTPHPIAPRGAAELFEDDSMRGLLSPIEYQHDRTGKNEVLVPRRDGDGMLAIYHGARYEYLSAFKNAFLKSVRSTRETRTERLLPCEDGKGSQRPPLLERRANAHLPKKAAKIRFEMRDGAFIVENVFLRLRSKTDPIELPLPYTLERRDGWLRFVAVIEPEKYPLQEIYWEVYAVIRHRGSRGLIPIKFSPFQRRMLYLRNQQWRLENGKVLFTHIAKGGWLSFVYRDYYPDLDTYALRVKELAALCAYVALKPYWDRKRIWIVFEKFCKLAQDNGYYFFDYCMGLPASKNGHIYYLMDKSQPDYENVRAHDGHVIDFMSFKHLLYCLAADIYIGSDSKSHLYVWRPKPSVVRQMISRRKILFLQHGVTAMKQVDPLFGTRGSSPMTYFLTTSKREQQIVVDHFGYPINRAPILGFSRWDVLEDRSTNEAPSILLMPTWRPWLEEQDDELFVASDYFAAYSSLITSEALADVLERRNATLRFFIHPKLSERLANFKPSSRRIELVAQGSEPLNQVMMECSMLVTDYSSVCWDMLYVDKPVVFYQFDRDLYESTVGSYVDLQADLPGDVCDLESDVIAAIDACAGRGFALTGEQKAKADRWFAHKDTANRRRTYNFIVEKGF